MNAPLRRLAIAVIVMFGALLLNANYLQLVRADDLNDRQDNARVLLRSYEQQRGPIVAGRQAVARSIETNDRLKYLRRYPQGPTYAHVTGYFSLVYNASGIELFENSVLSGQDDRLIVRRLSDLFTNRTPRGGSVVLTLNPRAQEAAFDGLRGKRGAAVALDPRTGAILAMASAPSYDPEELSSHDTDAITKAWDRLNAADAQPMLNRAISQLYPPGSTFKVVTTAAALESGRFRPDSQIPAPRELDLPLTDRKLHNFGGSSCSSSGRMSLRDALRISCNTAFAGLGMRLGADALRDQAESFGFDSDRDIPLPVEASHFPEDPDEPQTAQSAIGQFDVQVTPLQMAMVAAGIANRGVVMAPYLVRELRAPDLSVLQSADPDELGEATNPSVSAQLTDMMVNVVENGTASSARIPGVAVAGKTGTAQHATGQPPHAWFIAFAPADNPQVAVAVVVEGAGSASQEATGGRVAAPIARAVMEAVLGR